MMVCWALQCDGSISKKIGVKSGVSSLHCSRKMHSNPPPKVPTFTQGLMTALRYSKTKGQYKDKERYYLIGDVLFAISLNSAEGLQNLMDSFSDACELFGLIISPRKTQFMRHNTPAPPCIEIKGEELNLANQIDSTCTDNFSLDAELTIINSSEVAVYKACSLNTLMYGSESRPINSSHMFDMMCLRRIIGSKWQNKFCNTDVHTGAGINSIFSLLLQKWLYWLSIFTLLLAWTVGWIMIVFQKTTWRDVWKRDMKATMQHQPWHLGSSRI